jgi:mono/diheme cytochrome c family protein
MRHLLGNIAIYVIALFLVCAAVLFGWIRSVQLVISDEAAILQRFEPAPEKKFVWAQLGEKGYMRNCANCHGAEGRGWDQYPGLGGSAYYFQTPGGRDYFVNLHLYGLTSKRWGAPMPPMGHIQDTELAAIINYVLTHFGNERIVSPGTKLLSPEDVAQGRGRRLSPAEVDARRPDLSTAGFQEQ